MTGDKTYTFTRGIDTVRVTIGRHEVGRARARLLLVWGSVILCTFAVGLVVLPLLVIPVGLTFYVYGKVLLLEQVCREKAEAQAIQQFERFESERWRAFRALGRSDAR